ncbi:MAG: aminotransferase class I/II-fold pyridoxal phosphate-dependent enzyme [Lachnospiraceae bacterium]|nr:aminotransferase class I/II-fold pyridoxal phosphate-dependent enzyme [Lachnospiraceae bacterium]
MNGTDNKEYETLYEKLEEYSESDYYPFHMPGHKRNQRNADKSPYLYDITEIDGFDCLHYPKEIIKKRIEKVSEFYKSKKSYYLINGSTCGIMSALSAASERKKTIIMARNSHQSSYNTLFLLNLKAEYLYPSYSEEYGIAMDIQPEAVEKLLAEYDSMAEIAAIFITSPTYEGVVSNIKEIAEIAHKRKIPLIVDEAHGAHFGMHAAFPHSALEDGADIVIQSLHKTLPSLTQTAILHISRQSLIAPQDLERYLRIYQSSSPSYVLLAGIDRCMDILMKEREILFGKYAERLNNFRKNCREFRYFKLFSALGQAYDYDKSKLVIIPDFRYYNGMKLYNVFLNKYHLQMEMASERYVIAMTSVNDTDEGFERLYYALEDMEREIRISVRYRQIYSDKSQNGGNVQAYQQEANYFGKKINIGYEKAVVCRKIRDAYEEKYDMIELEMAKGKISTEFIYLYPPGIPILAPGEIITESIIQNVKRYLAQGLNVQGLSDESCHTIKVVRENWKPFRFESI